MFNNNIYNSYNENFETPILINNLLIYIKSANHIKDNIYLGDWNSSCNKIFLTKKNIKCIICLAMCKKPQNIIDLYKKLNIKYYHIFIDDNIQENILQYFNKCIKIIKNNKNNNNNILIHCQAGVSRSASIVIAYIMKEKKLNFNDAFKIVSEKRYIINPNEGFKFQLLKWNNIKNLYN